MDVQSPCAQAREQLSARLDGEDDPAARAEIDAHLSDCAACARWWQQAQRIGELTLSEKSMARILSAAPKPPRAARFLRLALLVVGVGQFLLGIAQIASQAGAPDTHPHNGVVSSGHLWHESAAWNVAIGAALAWLAWRRTKPAALIPVMTVFVTMLVLLTINDALAGNVDTGRIVSHGLVLAGYALLLALQRPDQGRQGPRAVTGTLPESGGSAPGDEGDGPLAPVYPFPARAEVRRRVAA